MKSQMISYPPEKMHTGYGSRNICNFPVYLGVSYDIYMIFKNNNVHKHIYDRQSDRYF